MKFHLIDNSYPSDISFVTMVNLHLTDTYLSHQWVLSNLSILMKTRSTRMSHWKLWPLQQNCDGIFPPMLKLITTVIHLAYTYSDFFWSRSSTSLVVVVFIIVVFAMVVCVISALPQYALYYCIWGNTIV